jgi:hypothetical protein
MNRITMLKIRPLLLAGLLLFFALAGAQATGEATLKLMVTDCNGSALDNASVRVVVHHAGSGSTDRVSGYTDDGYIELSLGGLQPGDEARVTVTASGGDPDADHAYVWLGNQNSGDHWDISDQAVPCRDGWWNQNDQVIHCAYNGGD